MGQRTGSSFLQVIADRPLGAKAVLGLCLFIVNWTIRQKRKTTPPPKKKTKKTVHQNTIIWYIGKCDKKYRLQNVGHFGFVQTWMYEIMICRQ